MSTFLKHEGGLSLGGVYPGGCLSGEGNNFGFASPMLPTMLPIGPHFIEKQDIVHSAKQRPPKAGRGCTSEMVRSTERWANDRNQVPGHMKAGGWQKRGCSFAQEWYALLRGTLKSVDRCCVTVAQC